jgi:CRP-like cAMP-binding protein
MSAGRTNAQAASILARWRLLLPVGPALRYEKHTAIFSQGDAARSLFLLARGAVKLVFACPAGGSSPLGLRYPGHLIGDWWQHLDGRHLVSAVAAVTCEVHRLDAARVRAAEQRDLTVAGFHQRALERDICDLATALLESKMLSPADVLERLLWELTAALDGPRSQGAARLVMPLTNAEMADLCRLSESRYKEVRRSLEAAGKLRRTERRVWILQRQDEI